MGRLIEIDGAQGEGGGQILRSALALSLVTGQPFRIARIRAGREKPGLLRQHLTAIHAASAVGAADVSGAQLGSTTLEFSPSRITGGDHRLAVGTAGSATLVLQAVLPALLVASEPTRITLEGGTHNPMAPPFDFLAKSFVPLIRRMGASIELVLEAHGFYPAGGGRFTASIEPGGRLTPLVLMARGEVTIRARALVSSLPHTIASREIGIVRHRLGLDRTQCFLEDIDGSPGPGNVVIVEVASNDVTEVITGFGIKGVTAEQVASEVCDDVQDYLDAGVPVGTHLADQLLLPMALAGGGAFRTLAPSAHTNTNIAVIRQFLDLPIRIEREQTGQYRIALGTAIEECTT